MRVKIITVTQEEGEKFCPTWKRDMQVIETDMGRYIDQLSQDGGYDWQQETGKTVECHINKSKGHEWIRPCTNSCAEYFIKSVKTVPGNSIVHFWKNMMQKIETDKGIFIDDIPGKGHDWLNEIGKTVFATESKSQNCNFLWLKWVNSNKTTNTFIPQTIENKGKEKLPSNYDINENQELKKVYEYIKNDVPVIFLTGGAGTGKSTFIKYLKNNLKSEMNKNCVILAPTGIAAINVKGQTIHKFFNFPFDPFNDEKLKPSIRERKNPVIDYTDLIIIDEISMVRSCMLDHIDYALREWCNKEKPFGGKQILLIGDCFQLPPVKSEEKKDLSEKERNDMLKFFSQWDNPFFFAAKALSNIEMKAVQLKKIYRQQDDQPFIHILNRIRQKMDGYKSDIDFLNKKCYIKNRLGTTNVPNECLLLTTTNEKADEFNNKRINELLNHKGTKSQVFMAFMQGEKSDFDSHGFLTPEELRLCVGAKIMITKNINNENLVNGDMGKVVGFGENGNSNVDYVEIEVKKIKHRLTRETWQSFKYTWDEDLKTIKQEVTGTFTQIPLKLGWGITIHKSQGLTLDAIAIDAANAWDSGQVYVALSRAKNLDGIFLCEEIPDYSVKTDEYVEKKYKELFPETDNENEYKENEYQNIILNNSNYTVTETEEKSSVMIGGIKFDLYPKNEKKIGRHAEETISKLLLNDLIPNSEKTRLLEDKEYCYDVFGICYDFKPWILKLPLLCRKREGENKERYWATNYNGYYICSQWYKSCDSKLAKWLIDLSEGKLNKSFIPKDNSVFAETKAWADKQDKEHNKAVEEWKKQKQEMANKCKKHNDSPKKKPGASYSHIQSKHTSDVNTRKSNVLQTFNAERKPTTNEGDIQFLLENSSVVLADDKGMKNEKHPSAHEKIEIIVYKKDGEKITEWEWKRMPSN